MLIPSEGELYKEILGPTWGQLHPDIQRHIWFGTTFTQVGVLREVTA